MTCSYFGDADGRDGSIFVLLEVERGDAISIDGVRRVVTIGRIDVRISSEPDMKVSMRPRLMNP